MGIFAQIQSAVDSILPQLYEDDDLTSVVVWKKFADSNFDEDEGVNVDSYTDYEDIKAIRVEKEIGSNSPGRTYPPGPWSMASGEVQFLFQYDSVPVGASIRDLIVDGSLTYSVKKIFPVFGLIVKVDVEGYA